LEVSLLLMVSPFSFFLFFLLCFISTLSFFSSSPWFFFLVFFSFFFVISLENFYSSFSSYMFFIHSYLLSLYIKVC
jgi:hypothetical protein